MTTDNRASEVQQINERGDTMADFYFSRHFERPVFRIGVDQIFDVEYIPAWTSPGMQTFDIFFYGNNDVKFTNFGYAFFTVWYLPFFEGDADGALPVNWASLKALLDKRVTKVEASHPAATVKTNYDMKTSDEMGLVDTNLIYRPDRISLRSLETRQLMMPATQLYRRIIRLGMISGNYYRTGDADKMRYMARVQGSIQTQFSTSLPGVIVWVLTIPPEPTDDEYVHGIPGQTDDADKHDVDSDVDPSTFFPTSTDGPGGSKSKYPLQLANWDDYGFLAPQANPITGELQYPTGLALVNNFRNESLKFAGFLQENISGTKDVLYPGGKQFKQDYLGGIWSRDITFRRSYATPNSLSPAG